MYRKDLPLRQGVTFENHTNTLSDTAEDVQTRLQLSSSSSNPRRPPKPIHADQICMYKNEEGQTDILFIIEYKAPHKLTKEVLRAGLREMDVPKEAINRPTIPTDLHEKFSYNADRLVVAAATGEAIVFLWIKTDDSNTLYYYLAEPNEEVSAGDGFGFQHPLTAIGQLLSFCLMALRTTRRKRSCATFHGRIGSWIRLPPSKRGDTPPPSDRPITCARRSQCPHQSGCSPENKPIRDDRDDPAEGPGPESIKTKNCSN